MPKNCDFEGWVAKYGVVCTDNTVMQSGAFAHQNGTKVPLVYQHNHGDVNAVIGHSVLFERPEGVWAMSYLNETDNALAAAECVKHGDLDSYSIFANKLSRNGRNITHGDIREVSLVLSGADPTARIEKTYFAHADGTDGEYLDTEGVVYTGEKLLYHSATEDDDEPEDGSKRTGEDIIKTFNKEQKEFYDFTVEQAIAYGMTHPEGDETKTEDKDETKHDDTDNGETITHSEGGNDMPNVFEQYANNGSQMSPDFVAHSDSVRKEALNLLRTGSYPGRFSDAVRNLINKDEVVHSALDDYGIQDIDILFPDAKMTGGLETLKRDDSWCSEFINAAKHLPYAVVKTVVADYTAEELKAKGYIKGNKKIEGVMRLAQRVTHPTTVYVKRKIDEDDITDSTDFDVLQLIQADMKPELIESIAVASLVGDGRSSLINDKIKEDNIRPVWTDDTDLFVINVVVEIPASATLEQKNDLIESAILRARKDYKGSGNTNFYTTEDNLTDWRLMKDGIGHKLYKTDAEVADVFRCKKIVACEQLVGKTRVVDSKTRTLYGIILNPVDYAYGTNQGGQIKGFNGFDIDYNQRKFLQETRTSGALRRPFSAIVVETVPAN